MAACARGRPCALGQLVVVLSKYYVQCAGLARGRARRGLVVHRGQDAEVAFGDRHESAAG